MSTAHARDVIQHSIDESLEGSAVDETLNVVIENGPDQESDPEGEDVVGEVGEDFNNVSHINAASDGDIAMDGDDESESAPRHYSNKVFESDSETEAKDPSGKLVDSQNVVQRLPTPNDTQNKNVASLTCQMNHQQRPGNCQDIVNANPVASSDPEQRHHLLSNNSNLQQHVLQNCAVNAISNVSVLSSQNTNVSVPTNGQRQSQQPTLNSQTFRVATTNKFSCPGDRPSLSNLTTSVNVPMENSQPQANNSYINATINTENQQTNQNDEMVTKAPIPVSALPQITPESFVDKFMTMLPEDKRTEARSIVEKWLQTIPKANLMQRVTSMDWSNISTNYEQFEKLMDSLRSRVRFIRDEIVILEDHEISGDGCDNAKPDQAGRENRWISSSQCNWPLLNQSMMVNGPNQRQMINQQQSSQRMMAPLPQRYRFPPRPLFGTNFQSNDQQHPEYQRPPNIMPHPSNQAQNQQRMTGPPCQNQMQQNQQFANNEPYQRPQYYQQNGPNPVVYGPCQQYHGPVQTQNCAPPGNYLVDNSAPNPGYQMNQQQPNYVLQQDGYQMPMPDNYQMNGQAPFRLNFGNHPMPGYIQQNVRENESGMPQIITQWQGGPVPPLDEFGNRMILVPRILIPPQRMPEPPPNPYQMPLQADPRLQMQPRSPTEDGILTIAIPGNHPQMLMRQIVDERDQEPTPVQNMPLIPRPIHNHPPYQICNPNCASYFQQLAYQQQQRVGQRKADSPQPPQISKQIRQQMVENNAEQHIEDGEIVENSDDNGENDVVGDHNDIARVLVQATRRDVKGAKDFGPTLFEFRKQVTEAVTATFIETISKDVIQTNSWVNHMNKAVKNLINDQLEKKEDISMVELLGKATEIGLKRVPVDMANELKQRNNEYLDALITKFTKPVFEFHKNSMRKLFETNPEVVHRMALKQARAVKHARTYSSPTPADTRSRSESVEQESEHSAVDNSVAESDAVDNEEASQNTSEVEENYVEDFTFDENQVIKELEKAIHQNRVHSSGLALIMKLNNYNIYRNSIIFIYRRQRFGRISWVQKETQKVRVSFFNIPDREYPMIKQYIGDDKSQTESSPEPEPEDGTPEWNYNSSQVSEASSAQKRPANTEPETLFSKKRAEC